MLKKIAFAAILLTLSTTTHARGFDIKLAETMAEFTYLTESSTFGYGGADIGFGLLFTEDDDYQLNAKLMISGNPAGNNKAFQFGVGGKIMAASFDIPDEDVSALALAGQIRYIIPSSTPVAFLLGVAYAPGITSFSGAESYTEYEFAIEIEVTPSARAYLGYRNIEYEFENRLDYKLDDGAHVGIKFEF
jgi:YfaZ precursor